MKRARQNFGWGSITVLCLAAAAVSQTPVTLTSAGGSFYDGIYVSPYYATVNGVANTPVVCDDFGDDSVIGASWKGSVVPFSGITPTNTSWGLAVGSLPQYLTQYN